METPRVRHQGVTCMINLFSFAQSDQSLIYLNRIFGSMNGIIPNVQGTPNSSGATITLIGTMFQTFNSIVLAVAALMIVYITIVGVMQTAHEGEFMKKWHGLWTPIRVVLGIGALFPTGAGYSGLQLIMMWVIVQGIGAADTLWNVALSYTAIMGSPYATTTLPSTGVSDTMKGVFTGLVCDATFREKGPNPDTTGTGNYYCNQNPGGWCDTSNLFTPVAGTTTYSMGPNGACGTLTYCDLQVCLTVYADPTKQMQNEIACASCKAQTNALTAIINTVLIPIANYVEQTDYSYRNFTYTNNSKGTDASVGLDSGWLTNYCSASGASSNPTQCCVPGTPNCQATTNPFSAYSVYDDQSKAFGLSTSTVQNLYWTYSIMPKYTAGNFIDTAKAEYMDQLTKAVTEVISAHAKDAPLSGPLSDARNNGWILAGGYYYFLGRSNGANLTSSLPSLSFHSSNPQISPAYANNRINFTAANALLQMMQQGSSGSGSSSGGSASAQSGSSVPNEAGDISKASSQAINDVGSTFAASTKPDLSFNPLAQLQIAGYAILLITQILYALMLVLSFAIGIVGDVNGWIIGTGGMNPVAGGLILLYMFLLPAFMGLLGILVTVGGTLAIYIPLIPYTIFTFGAIGWMLSVIEAMVAGPLVALGIIAPGGHHEVLGKAEPALMLLFNVFLRPSLMIFGLIASLLLASVVILMINTAFWGPVFIGIFNIANLGSDSTGSSTGWAAAGAAGNPLAFILFVVAYVMTIVSAMNKCFEAIHIIPEKVMRWIGGQGEQYGESAAVGEMKRGVESGQASATRAGEQGQQAAHKGAEARRSKAEEDKKKAGTPSSTPPSES